MARKPEHRQFPAGLVRDRRFRPLSVTAKAVYFVLYAGLPSCAIGEVIPEAIRRNVGCTSDELERAFSELEAAEWLSREGDVVRLRGCEDVMPWSSPPLQKYMARVLKELPPQHESRLVRDWVADIEQRSGAAKTPAPAVPRVLLPQSDDDDDLPF